ncbi:hypothetical protein, partial [Streptomyces griseofuscus]
TYLALTFGTLLSSQGTVASFVLTLSGFPPGFPSMFQTLSGFFCLSDHRSASMQKEIQSQDLTSLFSVRARTLSRRSVPSRSTTVQVARNGMQIRWVGGLDH